MEQRTRNGSLWFLVVLVSGFTLATFVDEGAHGRVGDAWLAGSLVVFIGAAFAAVVLAVHRPRPVAHDVPVAQLRAHLKASGRAAPRPPSPPRVRRDAIFSAGRARVDRLTFAAEGVVHQDYAVVAGGAACTGDEVERWVDGAPAPRSLAPAPARRIDAEVSHHEREDPLVPPRSSAEGTKVNP